MLEHLTPKTSKPLKLALLFWIMLVVLLLWLVSWFLTMSLVCEWTIRGAFGDMFGAINSLFSGLALGGVVFAILQQNNSLSQQEEALALQRNEVELTRKEIEAQQKQIEDHSIALRNEHNQNLFFQLIKLHNDHVDSVFIPSNQNGTQADVAGTRCFDLFWADLKKKHEGNVKTANQFGPWYDFVSLCTRYWERRSHPLLRYILTLKATLGMIEVTEDASQYSTILNAQFSRRQRSIIWYYAATNPNESFLLSCFFKHNFDLLLDESDFFDQEHYDYFLKQAIFYRGGDPDTPLL